MAEYLIIRNGETVQTDELPEEVIEDAKAGKAQVFSNQGGPGSGNYFEFDAEKSTDGWQSWKRVQPIGKIRTKGLSKSGWIEYLEGLIKAVERGEL